MADHSVFTFEPAFLARLERLRLLTRRVPAGGFKGEHRASHLGSGLEFADYRPYVEGDDVRHLDWRAYLRFDRLLLRMFEEHGDLAVYILLDCSHSMAPTPGSLGRRKFDAARRIAAALTYIALATLDRVTLAPYSGHVHQVLGPLHGSRQVWRALDYLANLDTGGETHLDRTVREVFAARRRRGLVIVISDLLSDTTEGGLDLLLPLRHDVAVIQVTDHRDLEAPLDRDTTLVDSETGDSLRIHGAPNLLHRLEREAKAHREEIRSRCTARGWSFIHAPVEASFEELALGALRRGLLSRGR